MIGGNIHNYFDEWAKITNNTTILTWIKEGIPLDFDSLPVPFEEKNNIFKSKEVEFLDKEIGALIANGCISKSSVKPTCVSRISTIPKKDGSFRIITDLRIVNTYLTKNKSFIYENITEALEIVQPSDKLVTIDIKSGFFHVLVKPCFRQYLGFSYRQQYYVWNVCPFGLAVSPYYFCKLIRQVVQYLRSEGLSICSYVDEFLLTDRPQNIEESKNKLTSSLLQLGYFINYEKSQLRPDFTAKFIGYIIQTTKEKDTVWLFIPKDRVAKVKHDIRRVVKAKKVSARGLARIAGQIVAMCKVLIPAKLLLRNAYRLLKTKCSWQDKLTLDAPTIADLLWWLESLDGWNGRAFKKQTPQLIQLTTDASGKSWGGTIINTPHKAQGFWDQETYLLHSNAKEMLAVLLTLKSLLHIVRGKSIQILSDSVTTCAYINFQGGAIRTLDIIARNIWNLAIRNNFTIQAKHLAGKLNTEADRLSRLSPQYEWYIHPSLFKYIDNIFGPHTVDRFASILTRQTLRYNSRFWDPETEGIDALHQNNWHQEMNFVNPPFRLLPKVIRLIKQTKAEATVIAPRWPAKIWHQQLIQMAVCHPIKLPKTVKMCIPCLKQLPEPLKNRKWSLFAWRISGAKD